MATTQRYYSPEEYLAREEVAEFRSEYRDGKIVPMTGKLGFKPCRFTADFS